MCMIAFCMSLQLPACCLQCLHCLPCIESASHRGPRRSDTDRAACYSCVLSAVPPAQRGEKLIEPRPGRPFLPSAPSCTNALPFLDQVIHPACSVSSNFQRDLELGALYKYQCELIGVACSGFKYLINDDG
jgi:hypothetical protein